MMSFVFQAWHALISAPDEVIHGVVHAQQVAQPVGDGDRQQSHDVDNVTSVGDKDLGFFLPDSSDHSIRDLVLVLDIHGPSLFSSLEHTCVDEVGAYAGSLYICVMSGLSQLVPQGLVNTHGTKFRATVIGESGYTYETSHRSDSYNMALLVGFHGGEELTDGVQVADRVDLEGTVDLSFIQLHSLLARDNASIVD